MRSANHAARPFSEEYAFFAQLGSTAFVCSFSLNTSMGSDTFSAPAMPSSSSSKLARIVWSRTIRLLQAHDDVRRILRNLRTDFKHVDISRQQPEIIVDVLRGCAEITSASAPAAAADLHNCTEHIQTLVREITNLGVRVQPEHVWSLDRELLLCVLDVVLVLEFRCVRALKPGRQVHIVEELGSN